MVKNLGSQITGLATDKKGQFSLLDAGLIAVGKSVVVDGFAQPMLNKLTKGKPLFNILSKVLVAGVAGTMLKGNMKQAGNIASTAFMVSAGDDIAGLIGFGSAKKPAGEARTPQGADTFGQSNRGEGIVRFI